jgi:hypothetical protein
MAYFSIYTFALDFTGRIYKLSCVSGLLITRLDFGDEGWDERMRRINSGILFFYFYYYYFFCFASKFAV